MSGGGTVAIVQSNYIPWKGYFDLIARSDLFVLLDDVQYTRRDWRNRNRIKTAQGLKWLSIPVETKGKYEQLIRDTKVSSPDWARGHWDALRQAYGKAPWFEQEREWVEALYLEKAPELTYLSEINRLFLAAIAARLGITTPLVSSSDYELESGKTDRLLAICRQAGADIYLSGPAAQGYLDIEQFAEHGIAVEWMDYGGYGEYSQLYPPFEHGVSVLDLVFMVGGGARALLRY